MKKITIIVFDLMLLLTGCFSGSYAAIREPAVAGQFYPSDSAKLKEMVSDFLAKTEELPKIDGRIIAIIVPHAGYIYSGPVAAYSYKLLENSGIKRVILCGPTHRYSFIGLSVYGPGIGWKTPLGTVSCDDTLCNILLKYDPGIRVIPEAHTQEHCLEVQLPFLQTVLKDFKILPVIMGNPDEKTVPLLADALQSLPFDSKTIMIASTDWQHYRSASVGSKMDSLGMGCLKDLDVSRLQKYLAEGKVEMCGGGAAVAVIRAAIAKGANQVKILRYGDSGDLAGDKSQVVGYLAAVLYKSQAIKIDKQQLPRKNNNQEMVLEDETLAGRFNLNQANKKQLLKIARESIRGYLTGETLPEFQVSDDLQKFGAAFVTLTENNILRGCIGYTTAVEPLFKTVSACAVQAAVSDPRFSPVRKEEIDKLHIEISVLTPMKVIDSLEEIKIGRDGLMIFKGNHRGLLLPQVATEYGWDRKEFLEQVCVKANLDKEAYKDPEAVIYRFQVVVFGE
ncbi:MAG: AmmeMemoRadiSam system protein B [candidate division Zixibacteria bacterium]|nr:AmmeMemoRadiSam system protein B [candidate division Zixibacteria bacterium]